MGSTSGRHKGGGVMAAKRKRSRVNHSLETKVEVVLRADRGQTRTRISEEMGLPGSTVYTMLMNAELIKANARKAGIITTKPKAAPVGTIKKGKRRIVFHSLAAKLEVLRRRRKGETRLAISRAMNIPMSTVYEILKRGSRIREAAHKVTAQNAVAQRAVAAQKAAAQKAAAQKAAAQKAVAQKAVASKAASSKKRSMTVIPKNGPKDLLANNPTVQHKKWRPHSLATKLEIVTRCESGERRILIAQSMGVAHSTIHYIFAKAKEIKAEAKALGLQKAPASKVKKATKGCSGMVMENMERLLKIWMDQQQSQPGALTDETIRRKALSLWMFVWDSLRPEETEGLLNNFTASAAWLEKFKERSGLWSLPLVVAEPKAVSLPLSNPKSEVKALSPMQRSFGVPKGFSSLLRAKIEVGGYTPRQVINLDEILLLWKKPPANTIISLDEKVCLETRDQMSLMLGANATGDLKLKPLLVYRKANPASLLGYIKEYLPVIWRSHPRGRVVSALCQNYVVDYVSPRCKEYAVEHSLQNRFLLLVDSDPAYPPSMDDLADNIEVMFIPTVSTSVVQPMDNGITATFKRCYLGHLMQQLIRETDAENKESLHKFWQDYDVKKAVNNIKKAWDDLTPATLNTAWHSIWPECVHDGGGGGGGASLSEPTELEVLSLAHQAGFLHVTVKDIQEVMKSPAEETAGDPLLQAEMDQMTEGHEEGPEVEIVKTLDIDLLRHALSLCDEAMAALEDNDPNCTRSCDARSFLERAVGGYRELYAAKKRKIQNSSIFCSHFK